MIEELDKEQTGDCTANVQRLKTQVFSASVRKAKILLTLKARESFEAVFAY